MAKLAREQAYVSRMKDHAREHIVWTGVRWITLTTSILVGHRTTEIIAPSLRESRKDNFGRKARRTLTYDICHLFLKNKEQP